MLTTHADSPAGKNRRLLETRHLGADLGRRTASGGAIAVVAQLARMLLQVASSAVMARLLAPEDYGLVGMAATVTGLVGVFTDPGLSVATVQRKAIDQDTVSALLFVNVGVAIVVMLVAMLLAPLAAWGFGDKRIMWIVIALAMPIPLTAAAAQHGALLQRAMRWMTIQWIGIAAQLAGALLGIALAWGTELGYWALVAQGWAGTIVNLGLVWMVCPWRPTLVAQWTNVGSAVGFGLNLTGFNLVNYFHRQFDNVLIGWRWGASELGHYTRAYSLLTMPLALINTPVGSAVIPALSRLQEDREQWRQLFLKSLGAITLLSSGITAMMIGAAKPLVAVVYGPGWEHAAQVFGTLAISMFAATPMNSMGWIYISLGHTRRMFVWSMLVTPFYVLSFVVGLPYGAEGVALAYSGASWLAALPCLAMAAHGTPVSVTAMLRVVAPPTVAGIVSTAVGMLWAFAPTTGIAAADFLSSCAVIGLTYLGCTAGILAVDAELRSVARPLRNWLMAVGKKCTA